MPTHQLEKILTDLQEGARAVKRLQGELEVMQERSQPFFGQSPNLEAQFESVNTQLSTVWRDHLGAYDPEGGPIIGIVDVGIGDMTLDSVVGGTAPSGSSPAQAPNAVQTQLDRKTADEATAAEKLSLVKEIVNG